MDKNPYRHDGRADKDTYRLDGLVYSLSQPGGLCMNWGYCHFPIAYIFCFTVIFVLSYIAKKLFFKKKKEAAPIAGVLRCVPEATLF